MPWMMSAGLTDEGHQAITQNVALASDQGTAWPLSLWCKPDWRDAQPVRTPWTYIKRLLAGMPKVRRLLPGPAPMSGSRDPFYRSPEWHKAKAKAIKRAGGQCEEPGCNARMPGLHVHHIVHLADNPALGLIQSNLRVLCVAHHNARHPERGGSHSSCGKAKQAERERFDAAANSLKTFTF